MALICPNFKTRIRVVGTYYMQYDLKKYVLLITKLTWILFLWLKNRAKYLSNFVFPNLKPHNRCCHNAKYASVYPKVALGDYSHLLNKRAPPNKRAGRDF